MKFNCRLMIISHGQLLSIEKEFVCFGDFCLNYERVMKRTWKEMKPLIPLSNDDKLSCGGFAHVCVYGFEHMCGYSCT